MNKETHHLYRRDGIWWISIWITGENGEQKRVRTSTRTSDRQRAIRERDKYLLHLNSKKTAKSMLLALQSVDQSCKDALQSMAHGAKPKKRSRSEELICTFIDNRKAKGVGVSSLDHYKTTLNALDQYLKPQHLIDAKRETIAGFVKALELAPRTDWMHQGKIRVAKKNEDRMKDATRRNCVAEVKAFYRFLERNEYIERNPCRAIDLPAICDRDSRNAPTPEKAAELRAIPPVDGFDVNEWRLFVELVSRTGMRRGECAGLLTKNIHLDDSIPWLLAKNEKQGRSRTNTSVKSIPIPQKCMDLMRLQLKAAEGRDMLFSTLGVYASHNADGVPFEKYGVRYTKAWVPLAKMIWPPMDVHTWRHYCNIHVNRLFHQEVAKRLLGHSMGANSVNEIYNIRNLEQLRQAVDAIP